MTSLSLVSFGFFFQAEDGIRDLVRSRGLGDVYKRQALWWLEASPGSPDWKNRKPVFSAYTLDDGLTQQLSTPWGTHEAGL
mgnify:CR=1 FL=1